MKNKLISIVLPLHNEEGNINELYQRLIRTLNTEKKYDFEIIFVNDGSIDSSLKLVKDLSLRDNRVKYISLSRNFGHQAALTAGLTYAKGDAIIMIDADLQHPPELITELITCWEDGYQVVYTVRDETKDISFFKKITANIFYRLINLVSQVKIDPNSSDFRLIDSKICDIIRQNPERERFYRGLIPWIGFRQKSIKFCADSRFSGKTSYTLSKMLRFAISGILSFSFVPLLVIIGLSIFLAIASIIYILFVFYQKFISGQAIPGQASVLIAILIIGSVQLLAISITAIYSYKTYHEAKRRPIYIVDETKGFNDEPKS